MADSVQHVLGTAIIYVAELGGKPDREMCEQEKMEATRTLTAIQLIGQRPIPIAQTTWYHKEQATCPDVIAFVRRELRVVRYFVDTAAQPRSTKFNPDYVNHLFDHLSEAP